MPDQSDRPPLASLCFAVVLGAVATSPAAAQSSPPTPCDRLNSPYEQSACLEKSLAAADAALNQAYQAALARIDGTAAAPRAAWREALRAAQRAWIEFRDADCGALVGYEWRQGSGAGPAALACRLDKTERRARALRDRYAAH